MKLKDLGFKNAMELEQYLGKVLLNKENYYYICPKCEELITRKDEVFCQDCGQRIDWRYKNEKI